MKIIAAFDSFKECISASDACRAAASGVHDVMPEAEVVELPLSDGGEGLTECVGSCLVSQLVKVMVHDPLMRPVEASYRISDDNVAYMEMAAACGLSLVPPADRDPMSATTYGVGELLLDAASRGCCKVVMGIGGSATCDAGRGMLACLAENPGVELPPIEVACDVDNPLYGPNGAAYVFAPQKGATPEQVLELDERLRAFALETESKGIATQEVALMAGAGAAGGLGYGLMAWLGATLRPGIDIVLDILQFDSHLDGASIVLTGEGKSDAQTLMGKVPEGVLRRCKGGIDGVVDVHVHILSGCIEDGERLLSAGFASVRSINDGDQRPLAVLLQPQVASANLRRAAAALVREINFQK